jgi:hypothetical protein
MILLDTDHLSALKYEEHSGCRALSDRMNTSQDPYFATTIISAEEQMRGWLAKIHAAKDAEEQVKWYDQLGWLIEFLADWQIIGLSTGGRRVQTSSKVASAHRHTRSQDRGNRMHP